MKFENNVSKGLKSTFRSVNIVMFNQEYHKGQYLDRFFNIFICDLFFDDIDIDLANYADDTTPYAYDLELDKVIESLEKILISFFTGFRTF